MGSNQAAVTQCSHIAPIPNKEILDIEADKECRLALKCLRDMIMT